MNVIGVIGAGTMGRGVSQVFASKEYKVVLLDHSLDALKEAKEEIYNILRFRSFGKKEKNGDSLETILSRIEFTNDYEKLKLVDFIIENVNENYDVKKEIYPVIDKICREDVIFAINTSCISITKLASLTSRPKQVVGTHFMNPVQLINAVEVIKGVHTSVETLDRITQLLNDIGKESIIVEDFPGFVSNRISHLMMNEAAFIIQDKCATPEAVDAIFRKGYGHKMGPLETADLIGIDTVVDSLDVLFDSYKDAKFRCCPLLRRMVDAGLKGRKTGEGFYTY